jgi:hypothetical protein
MTTPEEEYQRTYNLYHGYKKHAQRKGKTPEAKVAEKIDAYLKKIGALTLRTSAGLVSVDGRKIQMGQAGTSDRTCCIAGVFVAIEIKARSNTPTETQQHYLDRVTKTGGLAFVARSVDDVRQALVNRFGERTVGEWEAT